MSKKPKTMHRTLLYYDQFLPAISAVSGCVLISAFASLVGAPIGIANSAVGLKICAITARIKKYKSITKEKKRSMVK